MNRRIGQNTVADEIGIPRARFSRWIHGESKLTQDELYELAKVLGGLPYTVVKNPQILALFVNLDHTEDMFLDKAINRWVRENAH